MMSPPRPWSIIILAAARETRNDPLATTSCWRSQSCSVVSSSGLEMDSPALFTTKSTPPKASAAASKAACTSSSVGDVSGDGNCLVAVADSFGYRLCVT